MPYSHTEQSLQLCRAARAIIEDFNSLLGVLSSNQFTTESKILPHSTIGKHIRHALDHFLLLLAGLQDLLDTRRSSNNHQNDCIDVTIDYDHRQRLTLLETDPKAAQTEFARICGKLEDALLYLDMNTSVCVLATTEVSGLPIKLASSMGREVWFTLHHAIHHAAIIRVISKELGVNDSDIPLTLGFAPSTVQHLSIK
ncbi:hypothetical protein BDV3_003450 [Batrachochytrium dendrobatidis]